MKDSRHCSSKMTSSCKWPIAKFEKKNIMSQAFRYDYPYQSKSMVMIWESLGHIWPICGNGMGRLDDDVELLWAYILTHFKLREVYGKKTWCFPLYGRAMGIHSPYISHSNETFPQSSLSMVIVWNIHTVLFHRLPIPADKDVKYVP